MGPLGLKLLKKETKGRNGEWTPAQLHDLNEQLETRVKLILGATQARQMAEKIDERLG